VAAHLGRKNWRGLERTGEEDAGADCGRRSGSLPGHLLKDGRTGQDWRGLEREAQALAVGAEGVWRAHPGLAGVLARSKPFCNQSTVPTAVVAERCQRDKGRKHTST